MVVGVVLAEDSVSAFRFCSREIELRPCGDDTVVGGRARGVNNFARLMMEATRSDLKVCPHKKLTNHAMTYRLVCAPALQMLSTAPYLITPCVMVVGWVNESVTVPTALSLSRACVTVAMEVAGMTSACRLAATAAANAGNLEHCNFVESCRSGLDEIVPVRNTDI